MLSEICTLMILVYCRGTRVWSDKYENCSIAKRSESETSGRLAACLCTFGYDIGMKVYEVYYSFYFVMCPLTK